MAARAKRTEAEMLLLLRRKFTTESGNGPAYAFVEHVRNDAGFKASRTIDAMTMSLWPSRGLRLAAYEIKCSRQDTLTELRNPAKAEAFMPYVDHFYLVVADRDFVKPGELPETWGLMAPHGGGLAVVKEAPLLEAQPIDRGMLAALLRQAGVAAATQPELAQARQLGVQDGIEQEKRRQGYERDARRREVVAAASRERIVCEAIGRTDLAAVFRGQPERFAAAVKAALDADRDLDHLRSRIHRLGTDARVLAEQAERILREHDASEADETMTA